MPKVCKRGHSSSVLPGGRYAMANGKPTHCKECTSLRNATPERRAYNAKRNATPERRAYNAKRNATPERKVEKLLDGARTRAKRRGLPPPTITLEWIAEKLRTVTHCPLSLCGHVKFERGKGKLQANSPTLDQRDVRITYTPENTELICHRCNTKKGNMTPPQLRELADFAELNSWLAADSEMPEDSPLHSNSRWLEH